MKALKSIIYWVLSLIAMVIFAVVIFILIQFMQEKLFVPGKYIMWVSKSPASRLVLIYLGFFLLVYRDFRKWISRLFKRHKKSFITIFGLLNIILLYTILTNITVLTQKTIIDHSFLSPNGKGYGYSDISKINAGVYGERQFFGHSKGDFFYIIELNDGSKIDLADVDFMGAKNEEDPRFILEKLDKKLVNMGIPKKASMDNFKYTTRNLDKIYTDKIRSILKNTK
ncbi:hypothetical protein [Neobacillus soli]|uniref:hypothetical protein n=1 Tax=Neobacillus soli TaxID=220688 RepID=UPI00082405D2|nr:hypothetical protein [Neobacillus soli]